MDKINEAINLVQEFLTRTSLSSGTLNNYQSFYRTICDFCERESIEQFGNSEAEQFIRIQTLRHEKQEISKIYFRHLRKAANLLANQMQGKKLELTNDSYCLRKLGKNFEVILAEHNEDLAKALAVRTCKSAVSVARQFLIFLENSGKYDITTLTVGDVKLFMIATAPMYSRSMSNLTGYIRKFLSFLSNNGIVTVKADIYLSNPVAPRKKVLPCFTDEEAATIFNAINTVTPIGKRDYAILKLAIGTGLRGVDIFKLKMMDIDWHKKEINICQDKTDVYNTLPLLPDVGNAIMDYILNGRPNVKNPHIFLRTNAPYDRLKAGTGNCIIQRYLLSAGIPHEAWDGKTFHALRRTTGTRLVRSGEPLESVRQILGPKYHKSLKPYIALDMSGLSICCLDISKYVTTKEGLI